MKFTMEPEDISEGVRMDCNYCPVANCGRRTLGDGFYVKAKTFAIQIYRSTGNGFKLAKAPQTPLRVLEFMRDFDANNPVLPFEFDLPVEEFLNP